MKQNHTLAASLVALLVTSGAFTSCESAPGSKREQGAVIGGVAGAIVGHQVGSGALGALIGGALGAGGGWLAGAELEKLDEKQAEEARTAIERARSDPATAADVRNASTADLNGDGYVTLDEIVALSEAGLNDDEILRRLELTGQVFELTADQKEYLVSNGVPRTVTERVNQLNTAQRQQAGLGTTGGEVIGRDPNR